VILDELINNRGWRVGTVSEVLGLPPISRN
jgi:hypothetical protein